MPIDPCLDGCLNHNIGATTVPVAGDDPCNSAGNGFFCPGSFWSYDAAAAGGAFGDCDRLFLRTGGDCNVDQWLEISLGELRSEVTDPVDGTDCCPSGTLWCNTVTGQTWISTNGCGGDLCTWCEICISGDLQNVNAQSVVSSISTVVPLGGIPGVPTQYGATATLTIANPSLVNPMAVDRSVTTAFARFDNSCGGLPAFIEVEYEWSSVSAAGPWNTIEPGQAIVNPGDIISIPLQGLDAAFSQPVGGSNSIWVRIVVSNPDGNFCGTFANGDIVITAQGLNYLV